jgi:chaperonin GroEL (HSP60 family)
MPCPLHQAFLFSTSVANLLLCKSSFAIVCVQGIVPGGGAALLHLSELVPAFKDTLTDPEEKLGAEIVMKSLRAPARIIAENAGAFCGCQQLQ